MLYLKCTKAVQKFLGLGRDDLVEPDNEQPGLCNWFVHMFTVDRRRTVIFMNERTLLSFILFSIRKTHCPQLPDMFLAGLAQLLTIEQFPADQIEGLMDGYTRFGFTKTESRKSLGNLNDLVFHYRYSILDDGGFASCDIGQTIHAINRMPQRRLNWKTSIEATRLLLD